jgi:hypothetical protein
MWDFAATFFLYYYNNSVLLLFLGFEIESPFTEHIVFG